MNTKAKWGGRRKGAGVKPISDCPKVKINITIDADLLEKINSLCKRGERSKFIEKLLIESLGE